MHAAELARSKGGDAASIVFQEVEQSLKGI